MTSDYTHGGIGRSSRGFTLLYAVLVSSILLAIGIAIFEITVRELRLSSIVRESEYAFYAADSGVECALYWDVYASTTRVFYPGTPQDITCGGQTISSVGGAAYGVSNTFSAAIPDANRCASVTITKTALNSDPTPPVSTVIDVRGYNVPCADVTTDSSAVERTLHVVY